MLDIRKIKENPDAVKSGLKAKEVDCDAVVDKILELDEKIRALKTSTETQTAQKNRLSKENGKLFGQKKGAEKKGEDTSAIDAQIAANSAESVALDKAIEGYGGNVAAATAVGKLVAERALAKGIDTVVFDRGGYVYHGRVQALAEAARESGLKF